MEEKLKNHLKRVTDLAEVLDLVFNDDEKAWILIDLQSEEPQKRARNAPNLQIKQAMSEFF